LTMAVERAAKMKAGQEIVYRGASASTRALVKTSKMEEQNLGVQVFAPYGTMAIEHARQSIWEQGVVGALCAVGGSLLAYWSMQGMIGLAVIALCVIFSTLVTAALCHYYDNSMRETDPAARLAPAQRASQIT